MTLVDSGATVPRWPRHAAPAGSVSRSDPPRKKVFDKRLPHTEPKLRELFAKSQAKHGTVLVVLDQPTSSLFVSSDLDAELGTQFLEAQCGRNTTGGGRAGAPLREQPDSEGVSDRR